MIYLDNSATTRVCPEAVAAMTEAMTEDFFNPSALYAPSAKIKVRVDEVRALLLKELNCQGGQVIFTSGGTESDNLAVMGHLSGLRQGRVLYTAGEHPAVREAVRAVPYVTAEEIPLTGEGLPDLEALEKLLREDVKLICVMQVNNETGAVSPLKEIAALRDRLCPGAALHVDGVQGFLRVPMPMDRLRVDSYALSAHKIRGPKGMGALVTRSGFRLAPRIYGGGQEKGLRSGTENIPGILGLGAAVNAYPRDNDMAKVKARLYERLMGAVAGAAVNGPLPGSPAAAPHILNMSLPPVRSETMVHALETAGIYIGVGSACGSRKQKISPVLKAMHVRPALAESALRFSLSPDNTLEEMDEAAEEIARQHALWAPFQRR